MISEILSFISLIREIQQLTRKSADGLNFNIVRCKEGQIISPGDHLRIINLLPVAICAVRFWLQQGMDECSRVPINHVYHASSDEQPFGNKVTYRVPVSHEGVFLYPRGIYYVPLAEYSNFNWDGDVRVKFYYSTPNEGEKEGNLQIAVKVEVV